MKVYNNPNRATWNQISKRPIIETDALNTSVSQILKKVKSQGDTALKEYTLMYDKASLDVLHTTEEEINKAVNIVPQKLKDTINKAYRNIIAFHESQQIEEPLIETTPGVKCWRKSLPIEKVGLYIPGGSAPLFSTILMLGIPAKIARCKQVILCTPPDHNGEINPAILYTADLLGIYKIYKIGGAQAIAAMAFGTESIPAVYKIFGPGNQYVTKAKELIQQAGVAIDMPAGPSEVLVIADQSCNPSFVAADLLSQAEHGPDSQVVLLSNDEKVIYQCITELEIQIEELPRKDIAKAAIQNSMAVLLPSIDQCIEFSNIYAPEHLIIASENPYPIADKVTSAGSVFLGNYSCESAGDYASGTNHTLPTNGFARNYSGVSLDSFVKKVTFQELSKEGIQNIGGAIEIMAEAEQLIAHKNAVTIRLKTLEE